MLSLFLVHDRWGNWAAPSCMEVLQSPRVMSLLRPCLLDGTRKTKKMKDEACTFAYDAISMCVHVCICLHNNICISKFGFWLWCFLHAPGFIFYYWLLYICWQRTGEGGREGFCISYRDNKVLFIKNKVLSFLGNIWIQWSRLVIILQSGDHVADLHVGTEFVMCVCLWVEGICCWNDCACIRRKVLGSANEVVIPPVMYLHRFREVFNKSSHWTINGHWL